MTDRIKTYFASDFHLGVDTGFLSKDRERFVIKWLGEISQDARAIYLLGDIFDFWFEYKRSVPKGYFRLFAKLADLVDNGIEIFYFKGNHDMWLKNYFQKEIGLHVIDNATTVVLDEHQFFLAHGDGLGNKDLMYTLIKRVSRNSFCQYLFGMIHPRVGLKIMKYLSKKSRQSQKGVDKKEENNLSHILFCEQYLAKNKHIDWFIMGHHHLPEDVILSNETSRYINIGDWTSHFSYAVWDGNTVALKYFNIY